MKSNLILKPLESGASLEEVVSAYNELVDKFEFLSTKLSTSNFDGQVIQVELNAGEEKKIPHALGVTPNYCVILSQSGNGVISDDPLKKNQHHIYLKNNGSITAKVKILLLKE